MKYYLLRALFITLWSASVLAQNPTSFDYEDDVPPQQTGGQRSVQVFVNVHQHPKTGFSCVDKQPGQYYADPDTKCAVYYVCIQNERGSMSAQSFACPNGTIFSQSTKVCASHEQVYCQLSTRYYDAVHGNIDSKGQEEHYKPPALQPWRKQSSSRPQPPAQPPVETQPQPQARPQPQSRPQPQTRPQPQSQPLRPSLTLSAPSPPLNSRRNPFTTTTTTTSTAAPPPPEYEYEYVDYALPNETLPGRAPLAVSQPVRTKRETPTRRKGQLPSPFEFLSAPHIITSFNCEDKVPGVAYADTQTDCKMFHVCIPFTKGKLKDYQLYCESNKAFNQESGVCEQNDKVNCNRSQKFYVYNKWFRPQESRKDSWKTLMKKSIKSKSS